MPRLFQNGEAGRPGAKPRTKKRARAQRRDKGVALMIAIISIAILTAVATEFAYATRVDMQMAANQRDDTRAYYMARSGIGLSRLLLSFQKQLDNIQIPPGLMDLLGGGGLSSIMGGQNGAPPGGAQTAFSPSGLNIRLWEIARIDCYMLQAMVPPVDEKRIGSTDERTSRPTPSDPELAADLAQLPQRDFGGFEGCFDVKITPEDTKINVNGLDMQGGVAGTQLLQILSDKRFEFLFDHDDANKVRVTPQEVVINIMDWADPDKVQTAISTTGAAAGTGLFQKGFSDENSDYSRYEPRYEAKNAYFDSLDELYMVHGVNDAVMAAMRDRLTVYSDPNKIANINTDDPVLLWYAMLACERPSRPDPKLRDPLFVAQLIKQIQTAKGFSFFGLTPADFLKVLQMNGVDVDPGATSRLDNKVSTFTIKSTGEAGSIKKTLTAVVRMGAPGTLGQLLYWREE